jgi:hypothetical protein
MVTCWADRAAQDQCRPAPQGRPGCIQAFRESSEVTTALSGCAGDARRGCREPARLGDSPLEATSLMECGIDLVPQLVRL